MYKLIILFFVFIQFSFYGCSSQQDTGGAEIRKLYKERINSKAIKECEKNGGKVQEAGIMALPHCVITYPDAGKPCKNSSECTKSCLLIESNEPMGALVTGECQHNNLPFGCYAPVENGIAGPAICVD